MPQERARYRVRCSKPTTEPVSNRRKYEVQMVRGDKEQSVIFKFSLQYWEDLELTVLKMIRVLHTPDFDEGGDCWIEWDWLIR